MGKIAQCAIAFRIGDLAYLLTFLMLCVHVTLSLQQNNADSPALRAGVIIFKNGTLGKGATKATLKAMQETSDKLESVAWELAAVL